MTLHHGGFPIRKSADRSLFAAPRGLSQLVTSFFGSLCQGIHLMLLFAWTFLLSSSLILNCLSFINKYFWLSILLWKGFILFAFWIDFSTFRVKMFPPSVKLYFYPNWKDLLIFANLLVKSLCPLICSFLTLQYFIRFSMNVACSTRCVELRVKFPRWLNAIALPSQGRKLAALSFATFR